MSDQFKYARFKRWVRITTIIFFFLVMAYAYFHLRAKQKGRSESYTISTALLPSLISPR
ncbi:MAG: hypothetical protein GXO04_06495 [Aquificae bacterium]|nr:hypothetical protein [Aquificota bacterium]